MARDTLARVVDCIAATTRYPVNLLTPNADLETDLGIDSVKRVEIVLSLGESFGLDLHAEVRDPTIRTIGDVAMWIEQLLPDCREKDATLENRKDRRNGEPNFERTWHAHLEQTGNESPKPHLGSSRASITPVTSDNAPLKGRIAFITGSGRGVGRTISRTLAARGASVIINSFHSRALGDETAAEIRASGGSAIHLWGSVANSDHINEMFKRIECDYGHLDILICNASDGRIGSFMDLTADEWDRAFRTNVIGHHQCAVLASKLMRSRGGGSIVTLSAVGAHQFIEGLGSQGVVKAAVESMTRYLACELGQFGIRVNCVAGGPVYGDLLSKFPASSETQSHWESITPDGELCSPLDIAQTIAFLVSDEARGINGAVWMVDHGFSAIADGRPVRKIFSEIAV